MPELSLSPGQAGILDEIGATAIGEYEDGDEHGILAVDLQLAEYQVTGEGAKKVQDGPDLGLPTGDDAYFDAADPANVTTQLRRPFTPSAVKWKVQVAMPKNNPKRGLIVPYIDVRLVVERLNLVCPGLWHEAPFEPVQWGSGGIAMLCKLTVGDVTHQDVGSGYKDAKALVSDALKRAAVKFGIGVSLYAMPKITLEVEDGYLRVYADSKGNKHAVFTTAGEAFLPFLYTRWLHEHGIAAFGLPLDHGDSARSLGDVEGDGAVLAAGPGEDEEPELPEAVAEGAQQLRAGLGGRGRAKPAETADEAPDELPPLPPDPPAGAEG